MLGVHYCMHNGLLFMPCNTCLTVSPAVTSAAEIT